jgi:aconitate hydratase
MVRGTFANVRIKNLMLPGVEGGFTLHQPDGTRTTIYEASMSYQAEGVPLVVIAGHEYGTGSSRDWAAKGTLLLGVKAVIAESFERIHRSNHVGMGVLPLQFEDGTNSPTLGLDGTETFDVVGIEGTLRPRQKATLRIRKNGSAMDVPVTVRIDTPIEVDYYENGGILPFVLGQLMSGAA